MLIDNPERIERMKGNIKLIKKLNSAENIAKLSMEIFENCEVDYSNTFSRRSVLDIIEDVPLLTK